MFDEGNRYECLRSDCKKETAIQKIESGLRPSWSAVVYRDFVAQYNCDGVKVASGYHMYNCADGTTDFWASGYHSPWKCNFTAMVDEFERLRQCGEGDESDGGNEGDEDDDGDDSDYTDLPDLVSSSDDDDELQLG